MRSTLLVTVFAALVGASSIPAPATAVSAEPSASAPVNGRIVFQGWNGDREQIYTVAADGSHLRQVTHLHLRKRGHVGAESPAFAPDGRTIAFDAPTQFGPPGFTHVTLFTIQADGTGLTELPLGVGRYNGDPAYSADGSLISFDQDAGNPDPKAHGIYVANADGSGAHRLTTAPRTTKAFDTESQWSPDGTTLAFTRVLSDRLAAIFTVRADGTGLRRLTPYRLDAASPDWSPDGTTIAFNTYWDSPDGKRADVATVPAQGGRITRLTHSNRIHAQFAASFRPSWAPDGSKLVYCRFVGYRRSGDTQLWTIRPDGTHASQLSHVDGLFPFAPDWGVAP